MGYRNYIGYIPKRTYNKIKSLPIDGVYDFFNVTPDDDGYRYLGVYNLGEELYEFGKYVDFTPPKGSVKTFFKKKETEHHWNCNGELKVVTKEFLSYIINTNKEKVKQYYNEMVTPFLGSTDNLFTLDNPSPFLNSVKTEYGVSKTYEFDFSLITKEEQTALFKIFQHIQSMRSEWVRLTPFDLDNGPEITTSWKYEYAIFELIRIYKSFDWKKNIMFYYGY